MLRSLRAEAPDALLLSPQLDLGCLPELRGAAASCGTPVLLLASESEFVPRMLLAALDGIVDPASSPDELRACVATARAGRFTAPGWFHARMRTMFDLRFFTWREDLIELLELKPLEVEVMNLIEQAADNKGIANRLGISLALAQKTIRSIFAKMGVPCRAGAVALWSAAIEGKSRFSGAGGSPPVPASCHFCHYCRYCQIALERNE